jgi:hypothetical protein
VPRADAAGRHFDRDRSTQAGVAGSIHFAHPTCTCKLEDLVRTEPGARIEGHVYLLAPAGEFGTTLIAEIGTTDQDSGLLANRPVRCDAHCVTWLVTIPRRCRVLDQPHVIRKDIPRDGSGRVFITRVLVVDPERHARTDGHIVERDLVSLRRDWL